MGYGGVKNCQNHPYVINEWSQSSVFITSPPMLAVYDVVHSLPEGGAGRGFPFTEDETRRHFSYLSGTFREYLKISTENYVDRNN